MRMKQWEVSRNGGGYNERIIYGKLQNGKNRANFQILLLPLRDNQT